MEFNSRINHLNLEQELAWLNDCVEKRIKAQTEQVPFDFRVEAPPALQLKGSPFAEYIVAHQLLPSQRLVLILSIAAKLRKKFFIQIISSLQSTLYKEQLLVSMALAFFEKPARYLPTLDTALFIMAGDDTSLLLEYDIEALLPETTLFRHNTIFLKQLQDSEDRYSQILRLAEDKYELFTSGIYRKPALSHEFPAEEVNTFLQWEDIVLPPATRKKADDMMRSLKVRKKIPAGMDILRYKKTSYRALFYGPPGTGKTITAGVFGKLLDQPVFRIDLSRVVSSYVGETEKNLARLFSMAESKNWILFFDEADALFSKRVTDIKNANDHYANMEVNYLLQRIESYDGTLILGTNHDQNLDEAFKRRFDTVIPFPLPEKEERLVLWTKHVEKNFIRDEDLDLEEIASLYNLSGSEISSAVFRAVELLTLAGEEYTLDRETLVESIRHVCENTNKGFAHPDTLHQLKKKQEPEIRKEEVKTGGFTEAEQNGSLHEEYNPEGTDLKANYNSQQQGWEEAMKIHLQKNNQKQKRES